MRTPRTTPQANKLYLAAQALLRRIPAGEKRRVRQRAQAMVLASLRQAGQRRAGA